ncbi:hypothetical protein EYZ11_001758 [Aspergillus tanneri]|uniref:ethanolamine kinase n=1 Tax=Aspergillus tanneri TaxID=1220188 RepID=A0A4S3JSH8_9EURO|nr:uncharacterized protein ATNIH1004_000882 [Aspergillus tanneri]KAA8651982.1 hypothetical protein ATNIH1004_000882 [Aspergillus tanneri]THC98779.1 hypothetical protein EYZ11_001758 [Aspergillus tanneri]
MGSAHEASDSLRYIALSYNHADSQASALRLVLTLNPHWEGPENKIEFVRFTDGITNTLLKVINRKPGLTEEQIDHEAVLMRAYGNHTEILIDRERETKSHALLASHGLAPPLLARFQNGLLYRFIRGRPATYEDLVKAPIWRGVARRLAQWHAVLPIGGAPAASAVSVEFPRDHVPKMHQVDVAQSKQADDLSPIDPRQPGPNLWTVLQKWIRALPTTTEEQRQRRLSLQKEFERVVGEFDDGKGLGENGLVFAHCDLLCANVITVPSTDMTSDEAQTVHFIDYEYATPSPAAFDIANHFAEWAGYDCDYNMMPSCSVRRQFLTEYVKSYTHHRGVESSQQELVDQLYQDVDRFRGIPGLYWGTWALIQAQISQIDFDYASYAELRLGEYYAWRRETDGSRAQAGEEMPLRERRWQEA